MRRGTVPFYRNAAGIPSRFPPRGWLVDRFSFLARRALTLEVLADLALLLILAWLVPRWSSVASSLSIDYWDSHNFLLQARRLFDPDIPLDPHRPRLLVGWLAMVRWLAPTDSLVPARLSMICVTLAYVFLWRELLTRLLGRLAGSLAAILLACQPLVSHYSFAILSDHLAGAMLAGLGLMMSRWEERKSGAFVVGILGAGLALSKHHFLLFFPFCLGLLCIQRKSPIGAKQALPSLFAYVVTLEIALRGLGDPSHGIFAHARVMLAQAHEAIGKPTPLIVYGEWLASAVSPGLLAWAAVGTWRARRAGTRPVPISPVLASLFVATGAYALVLFLTPHREARYLAPLLPLWLGALSTAGLSSIRLLSPSRRWVWAGAGVGAAMIPLAASLRDLSLFESSAHRRIDREMSRLVDFLSDGFCHSISACRFFVSAPSAGPTHDPYWSRYDLGPHYRSLTGLPTRLARCDATRAVEAVARDLPGASEPDRCLLIKVWRSPEGPAYLVALKTGGRPEPFFSLSH